MASRAVSASVTWACSRATATTPSGARPVPLSSTMALDTNLLGVSMNSESLPTAVLDGRTLTPATVVRVARGRAVAEISDEARSRNQAAERLVLDLVARGELMYGVTTGVGVLRSSPSALE